MEIQRSVWKVYSSNSGGFTISLLQAGTLSGAFAFPAGATLHDQVSIKEYTPFIKGDAVKVVAGSVIRNRETGGIPGQLVMLCQQYVRVTFTLLHAVLQQKVFEPMWVIVQATS